MVGSNGRADALVARISWEKPAADFGPSASFLRVGRICIQPHPSKPFGWVKLSGHFSHPREYAGQRNAHRVRPFCFWKEGASGVDDPIRAMVSFLVVG